MYSIPKVSCTQRQLISWTWACPRSTENLLFSQKNHNNNSNNRSLWSLWLSAENSCACLNNWNYIRKHWIFQNEFVLFTQRSNLRSISLNWKTHTFELKEKCVAQIFIGVTKWCFLSFVRNLSLSVCVCDIIQFLWFQRILTVLFFLNLKSGAFHMVHFII